MLDEIRKMTELSPYLCDKLEDEGIEVEVSTSLRADEFVAIKVDDYYNSLHTDAPPKSVDFVVVVDCACDSYILYILELKNVKSPKSINIKSIQEKFSVTIDDFLQERFKSVFLHDKYKYRHVYLYLVSNAYQAGASFKNHQEYLDFLKRINRRDTLKVDMNLALKIYKFKGKLYRIEYDIPPNPVIRKVT